MKLASGISIGPYQVIEQIGRGGMGAVFRAYQPALERLVAIKVLPDYLADQPGFRERFRQEAVAVARLRHPNILSVYDHGEWEGTPYIVSEYAADGTLADRLNGPLAVSDAAQLLKPVAAALDYAHGRGVVHRDVKPANILFTAEGSPVLTDFGLARLLEEGRHLTSTGSTMGTPAYMSPEQCLSEPVGPAADQYSLAVVAFQMLTGAPPYVDESPLVVILAHIQKPLPPALSAAALPAGVEAALRRGLAKKAEERFASCSEFVDALARSDSEAPPPSGTLPGLVAAPAGSTPGVAAAPRRRRRWLLAAALGVVVILGVLGALVWRAGAEDRAPAAEPAAGSSASPAATQPAPKPRAPVPVGPLVYQARLDGGQPDAVSLSPFAGADAQAVKFAAGGMTAEIKKPGGGYLAEFDGRRSRDYVAEFKMTVQPGSDLVVKWVLRGSAPGDADYLVLEADPVEQFVRLRLYVVAPDGDATDLGPVVKVPELGSGQPLTLTARVSGDRVGFWVDDRLVGEAANTRAHGATAPQLIVSGHDGSMTAQSIRVWALPAG